MPILLCASISDSNVGVVRVVSRRGSRRSRRKSSSSNSAVSMLSAQLQVARTAAALSASHVELAAAPAVQTLCFQQPQFQLAAEPEQPSFAVAVHRRNSDSRDSTDSSSRKQCSRSKLRPSISTCTIVKPQLLDLGEEMVVVNNGKTTVAIDGEKSQQRRSTFLLQSPTPSAVLQQRQEQRNTRMLSSSLSTTSTVTNQNGGDNDQNWHFKKQAQRQVLFGAEQQPRGEESRRNFVANNKSRVIPNNNHRFHCPPPPPPTESLQRRIDAYCAAANMNPSGEYQQLQQRSQHSRKDNPNMLLAPPSSSL